MTNRRYSARPCCCCKNWCVECNLPRCRPQQDAEYAPGTLNTEYLEKYPEKRAIQGGRTLIPGKEYVESTARFNGQTTNRADFTPKSVDRAQRKLKDSIMPRLPFEGTTTYETYHNAKRGLPSDPSNQPIDSYSGPFDGLSIHKSDFKNWGVLPGREPRAKDKLRTLPFDGTTTYKSDFLRKKGLPADPRASAPLLQSKNRVNYTTYAGDYVPMPFEKANGRICCAEVNHFGQTVHRSICKESGVPC